ncbi:hypothetical protein ACGFIV_30345 [Sphaerisporangium sp. NPDC049003]|uniref:hypothetical protein n=1 Tax=Sphaerisporangium sp. NPDC049003 TaxID=3364517 RepID=UPI00371EC13D
MRPAAGSAVPVGRTLPKPRPRCVFGADRTFFVVNGNSTANRVVGHHANARDNTVLVDRNCHKSIQLALTITGARPVYLVPERNGLGLAGPVPPAALGAGAVRERLRGHPLAAGEPTYAVITNSTYDGLCYDAVRVGALLSGSVPRLHFDEAWFAYGRFHPLYARRYGMAVDEGTLPGPDRPTVFATQSIHKLLAALSQGAMLHVRPAERAHRDPAGRHWIERPDPLGTKPLEPRPVEHARPCRWSARLGLLVAERLRDGVPYAGVLTQLAPCAPAAQDEERHGDDGDQHDDQQRPA